VCLRLRLNGDHLRRLIPALPGQNISYGLLRDGVRHTRATIFNGCEELLGEVGLRMSRPPAGAHAPCDGREREHESEKAESRDGKESMHAYLRRITRCMGFVQLIRSAMEIWLDIAEERMRRYELGTPPA
jgi:hypothetical protein